MASKSYLLINGKTHMFTTQPSLVCHIPIMNGVLQARVSIKSVLSQVYETTGRK